MQRTRARILSGEGQQGRAKAEDARSPPVRLGHQVQAGRGVRSGTDQSPGPYGVTEECSAKKGKSQFKTLWGSSWQPSVEAEFERNKFGAQQHVREQGQGSE